VISATLDSNVIISALKYGGACMRKSGFSATKAGGCRSDPDDDRVVECAAEAKSDYLITAGRRDDDP